MLADSVIDDAAKQLNDYRQKDTLPSILASYETLIEDYRRLKSDYEEERDARERYKKQAKGQERNPFVLVLVDGDGYVLHDKLIQRGADGGSDAAAILNTRVRQSLAEKGLEHCEIMIRVYANVAGLSKALSKAGLAGAEKRSIAPFIASFNRSYPLTDFVDAGEQKENADFKLRGLLRLYAENAQCKHLFFAACHDGGYVSELNQYRGQSDRFTLIRTPGLYFHDEFNKLGLGIEELHGVFRPLGSALDGPYPKPPQGLSSSNGNNKINVPAAYPSSPAPKVSTTGKVCHFHKLGKCSYGLSCKNLHVDSQSAGSPMRSTSKLSGDWRSESGPEQSGYGFGTPAPKSQQAFSPPVNYRVLPREADIPLGQIAVNKSGHRLDTYIEPVSRDMEIHLKDRSSEQRLCNAHHLLGSCNNPKCEYDHSSLEAELKPALETLARSVPCPKQGACRNARCTHGHVCQKIECSRRGGKNYCKLSYALHVDDIIYDHVVPAANKDASNGAYGDSGPNTSPTSLSAGSLDEDDYEDDEHQGAIMHDPGSMTRLSYREGLST
ncbi:unnamed protein product [Discula destructiva]